MARPHDPTGLSAGHTSKRSLKIRGEDHNKMDRPVSGTSLIMGQYFANYLENIEPKLNGP